jgi:hypothetical protein
VNVARLDLAPGLSWHTYAGWESGAVLPRSRDLVCIAAKTGHSVDFLQDLVDAARAQPPCSPPSPTPEEGTEVQEPAPQAEAG